MRAFWILLIALALGWGLWTLLGTEDPSPYDPLPPSGPAPSETPAAGVSAPVAQTTGVLTVTVRTPDGDPPEGTEAGYRFGDGERVQPVDRRGQVRFTDAPLGDLVVVAHAKGYRTGTQRRYLTAGVPTDVVLVLEAGSNED